MEKSGNIIVGYTLSKGQISAGNFKIELYTGTKDKGVIE
jgi:hypothetical protein